MHNWLSFLHQQGASINENNTITFGEIPNDYPDLLQKTTVTPLIHIGPLSIDGKDSARFLQGQVTCDIQQLSLGHNLTGVRCNPKGRTLTNFLLCQPSEDNLLMLMQHALVQSSIDELSKFAAFFKVQLADQRNQYQCIGISGSQAGALAKNITTLCQHSFSDGRQLLVVPTESAPAIWQQLTASATPTGNELWHLQDIRAGFGHVQTETTNMFLPQMLNFQATGGISFKKGCYTGQEVVARMKYLGKLKRRMYRIATQASSSPVPGSPCFMPAQEPGTQGQSIGNVVLAAWSDNSHQEMLLVLTEEASKSETLIIGEGSPQTVQQQPLPYLID